MPSVRDGHADFPEYAVYCSRCGDIKVEGEVIPANGHIFGGWQVTKMPTCYSLGEKIRFCENCDVYEVADVSMLDHKWGETFTVDVEATCIEEGQESIHCTVCGAIKEGSQQVLEKTDHTYGDWIIVKEPTCTVEGTKKKQCGVCEDTITETIPVTDHIWNEEYTIDRAATTTEEGSQSIHCSVCNEIKEGSEQVIPKIITGWVKENGTWFYLNDSGEYAKGWLKSGGVWYYLDPSTGAMITGWKQVGGTWYFFKVGGQMATGWQKIDNKWYFFKSSGAMAANEWCGGYWLNANGSWTYKPVGSWHQSAKGWWFGDTSGWYARNTTIKIDNKNYTFNASGYWVK